MDLHINSIPSLEGIHYQGRTSKFAKELINFFRDIIEFRDSAEGSKQKVMASVRDKFDRKKLENILSKHTGLVFNVIVSEQTNNGMMFTTIPVSNIFTNGAGISYSANPKLVGGRFPDRLDELKKSFDKKRGFVQSEFNENKLFINKVQLFVSVDSLLLLPYYHTKAKVYTAEECAAILLHEVGHSVYMIDKMGYLERSLIDFVQPIKINSESVQSIRSQIQQRKKSILDVVDGGNGADDISPYVDVLDTLDEGLSDEKTLRFFKPLVYLCITVLSLIDLLLIRIHWLFTCSLVFKLMAVNSFELFKASTLQPKTNIKDSDFMRTLSDKQQLEYDADEFVTMHGLSIPLITVIDKINMNHMYVPSTTHPTKTRSKIRTVNFQMIMMGVISSVIGSDSFHSDKGVRLNKVGETILSALRAEDLPKDVEDELMKQYFMFKRYAEQITKHSKQEYDAYKPISRLINKILTLGGLVDFLSKGRQNKDYITLMQSAEKLMHSELVYHQKRLEKLLS